MGQDVLVTVKGTRRDADSPPETIEVVSPGTYYCKNNTYYIIYRETALTGMDDTTTTIKSDGRTVTVIRNGSVSMRQVFEPGQSHRSVYQTGFSSMETVICPWQIEVDLTEHGGSIKLEYELVLAGVPAGTNSLEITVKKLLPASKS
ncbi:DUF1934 domain-containing protein [Desulforamulus hydrothermalis]|uniref:DUF1934 domain-containing protein n=1 Tax=Desulforamulus hydrothermalis TaxID=412895 RepID=UPI000913FBA2|nr:DUF1934 domain-containing protein [Desulforamulus hydrothermalis]SHH14655.1 Uncharacterized beta-barrel protein YwiB, DUF1934 family [Desulforamulus hydrothermalis Lam5 = DSM 18033]